MRTVPAPCPSAIPGVPTYETKRGNTTCASPYHDEIDGHEAWENMWCPSCEPCDNPADTPPDPRITVEVCRE